MNRSRIALAALAFGSASFLAPAAASANPWVDIASSGQSVPQDGTSGSIGQLLTVTGSGCTNPTPGEPTYMGEYVSTAGDPLSNPNNRPYETVTDETGTFTWEVAIGADAPVGRLWVRWYCATAPVSSIDDPAMIWVSPAMWMDITDPGQGLAAARTSAVTTSAKKGARSKALAAPTRSAASTAAPTISLTADPDALPAIDRVGISGPKVAAIKAKVDAAYAKDARGLTLLRRLAAGNAKATSKIDALLADQYVDTTADVVGAKHLSSKTADQYAQRLTQGEIRVNIVEDLALTVHGASWYNAR